MNEHYGGDRGTIRIEGANKCPSRYNRIYNGLITNLVYQQLKYAMMLLMYVMMQSNFHDINR